MTNIMHAFGTEGHRKKEQDGQGCKRKREKEEARTENIKKKVCKLLDHLRLRVTKKKFKNTLDLFLNSKMMGGMLPKMFPGQSPIRLGISLTI